MIEPFLTDVRFRSFYYISNQDMLRAVKDSITRVSGIYFSWIITMVPSEFHSLARIAYFSETVFYPTYTPKRKFLNNRIPDISLRIGPFICYDERTMVSNSISGRTIGF